MKKLFIIAAIIGAALIGHAQTNTPAQTSPPNFFQSISTYFTQFDTNSTTFAANRFDIDIGMDYISGINTAATLGLEYNFSTNGGFEIESRTGNAGIAGTILFQDIGIGYSIVKYDTKVTAFLDAGYNFQDARALIEPGIRVKKALTLNTFAGIGLSVPWELQSHGRAIYPTVSAYTGFTF